MPPSPPYTEQVNQTKRLMTRYDVICPSAPYENMTVHDEGKAYDLCYSLAEDYGYCQIRVNNIIIADYTV